MESEMNFEIKELTSEIRDLVTQIKKSWGWCCCNQNEIASVAYPAILGSN